MASTQKDIRGGEFRTIEVASLVPKRDKQGAEGGLTVEKKRRNRTSPTSDDS